MEGISKFEKDYPLETPEGVYALFVDYDHVKSSAYDKTDFDAVDLLIDFDKACSKVCKTERQGTAIYLVFTKHLTQREAAERMGISQQAIHQLIWNVINKVSQYYRSSMHSVNGGFKA
ncbi:hypothetical protein CHL76_02380 [Marinococcus halophilus]|uniref:RNA polymerase sigma-70 region 4 domain-containing protein n=1 Tax=Marinococcus halophilus TaxID=1371 RepID=A0A510Y2T6_MARHA|nr:sigma factor-like helix-turn-helix DNA-binding protein [Marinococcus halophilus]OZT81222.1 hypothetical protein CHL76_02380 [Marinococcus halophilus]GEK57161.1 hypothetical protein MHA01_00660 [Marinococcus halophilus]